MCLLVTTVSCAKTAKPIEVPFGLWAQVDPWNHVFGGGPNPSRGWGTFGGISQSIVNTHTHTRPFYGPFSGTTRVSRYQKGKTNLDFTEARDSEWKWHQLGHMQVCNSLQTDNHASTPPLSFLTGRMPFLPPNQQRQSTEGFLIALTIK